METTCKEKVRNSQSLGGTSQACGMPGTIHCVETHTHTYTCLFIHTPIHMNTDVHLLSAHTHIHSNHPKKKIQGMKPTHTYIHTYIRKRKNKKSEKKKRKIGKTRICSAKQKHQAERQSREPYSLSLSLPDSILRQSKSPQISKSISLLKMPASPSFPSGKTQT